MSIIVDIIFVLLAAFLIGTAAKKGFVLSLLEWVAVFAAVFIAIKLSAPVSEFLYDSFVRTTVIEGLKENLPANVSAMAVGERIEAVLKAIPPFVLTAGKSLGIDADSIAQTIRSTGRFEGNTIELIEANIAAPIITSVIKLISVLVLILVFAIAFKALAYVVSKMIKKTPLIGPANTLLGAIVGVAKTLVIFCVVCALLQFSIAASPEGTAAEAVRDSRVVTIVNEYNPLISMFE